MWKCLNAVIGFYVRGFREMTLGKTLWLLICLKLMVIFLVLKLFFFPDFLNRSAGDAGKDGYVSNELIRRSAP